MAATPETEAQLKSLATLVIKSFEQARMLGSKNSTTQSGTINITNVVTMQSTLDGLLVGTNLVASAGIFAANRANLVGFLKQAGPALQNQFTEYGKVLGYAGNAFNQQFANVFRDYSTNTKAVQSRGFVFGSPAAGGSNHGNGTIIRLNVDEWGNVLENQTSDAKIARCTKDATSTASFQNENFTLEGATAGRDALEEYGSGKTVAAGGGLNLIAISALNSSSYGVNNASFSTTTPAAAITNPTALTDLPNWTVAGSTFTSTNFQVSRSDGTAGTDYYRGFQGDTTPVAIKASPNSWTLSQNLTLNGAKFLRGGCYYFHVAVCRRSSADGTFTFTVGNSTVSVDLTTLANDTWALLKIAVTKATYYKNFGSPSVAMTIGRSGGSTGTVDFDDVTVGAFQRFDGGFYALVGGPVGFQVEDTFTFTDTECGSAGRTSEVFSITQKWLTRGFGGYLPAAPLPPVNVPTVAASATAGVVTVGNHFLACSFVDIYGRESALGPPSLVVTAADSLHKVDISNLDATVPAYIATIKVYMAKAGISNVGPYYYTGTSGTAGTTSFSGASGVNAADGSLTVASVAGITWADPT